jgi:hypothetical protein
VVELERTGVIKVRPVPIDVPPLAPLYQLTGEADDAVKVTVPEPQRLISATTGDDGDARITA